MRERRAPPPFTLKQLEALDQGRLSNLDRRLIDTAREALLKVDALAGELRRLQEEISTFTSVRPEHERCLIVALPGESIEVYADPRVKVAVCCVPETRRRADEEEAIAWALSHVPDVMRRIVDDANVKPQPFSVHCLPRASWELYLMRAGWHELLKEVDAIRSEKDGPREPREQSLAR